jgi:hypothetical protein
MNMNSKLNFIFVLTASMLGLVLFQNNLSAVSILPDDRVINVSGSVFSSFRQQWNLADKVTEAKSLLTASAPLRFTENRRTIRLKNGRTRVETELARQEIALAVLDRETGRVFEKRYWLEEADITRANAIRRNYEDNSENLPRFQPEQIDEEFSVITNWWNNFNSDWSIVRAGEPAGRYVVLADKFLMDNESLAYPEDRTGQKYSDIVYVPYSAALREDKTLIAAGKLFLNEHVRAAFDELAQARVESKSFPGQLVTDTITQVFVKNIFLTEQTDPRMMLTSNDGGLELAERVLIRLGTNGEKAFRYTVSKTGASGLGQIMPGTYASIVKGYSSAHLIRDIDIGRVDITNAIKASTLVFDDHLSVVVNRANSTARSRQIFERKSRDEIDEIRAAIYNGGPSKYKHLTGNISNAVTETVLFIRKFRMIRELGLFDQYANGQ